MHNSIGAKPLEVEALFWVHMFPTIAFLVLFILTVFNVVLFYLYNEVWHPFVIIIKTDYKKEEIEMAEVKPDFSARQMFSIRA